MQAQRAHHPDTIVILRVSNISFNYPDQIYFKGIRNISLDLKAGETLAIIGKSGSGKTTLLKCIYGLEDLPEGEVLLDGEKVLGPSYNLIPGHERMKLVSQDYYVLDNHTVEENIFDKLIGYTHDSRSKRANRLLHLLELTSLRNTRAKNLSSGQKQRVAIARALAVFPDLLLLDEPFSNLDHLLTEKLFTFITKEAKKQNTSVILITHLSEEALKYADYIAVMDQGKIVQSGKKWQVYYQPKNSKLAGLMGPCNIIRPEDLASKKRKKSKMLVRPDKISFTTKNEADLSLEVMSSSYNGKCYEVLCETASGHTLIVYTIKNPEPGAKVFARLNS